MEIDETQKSPEDVVGQKLAIEFNDLYNRTLNDFAAAGLSIQDFAHHMLVNCQAGMIATARSFAEGIAHSQPDVNMETICGETMRAVRQYTANFAETLEQQLRSHMQNVEAARTAGVEEK